ncbi:MAG TPA: cupin domain-containing protein [Polyangiaceae bacterium]|nr:cupin domain-containing protein [Polyangiaceae bacterium]
MIERRHPNVLNLSEAPSRSQEKGSKFGFVGKNLGQATGATGIGCSWYEVLPGRAAFPSHYHCANEEALYVLEGEGTLCVGKDTVALHAGDYVTFPPGPAHTHKLTNTGAVPLRYLCMSTLKGGAEVVGYPDSNKIAAVGVPAGWRFPEPGWVRLIVRADTSSLDYYDGEDVG